MITTEVTADNKIYDYVINQLYIYNSYLRKIGKHFLLREMFLIKAEASKGEQHKHKLRDTAKIIHSF